MIPAFGFGFFFIVIVSDEGFIDSSVWINVFFYFCINYYNFIRSLHICLFLSYVCLHFLFFVCSLGNYISENICTFILILMERTKKNLV